MVSYNTVLSQCVTLVSWSVSVLFIVLLATEPQSPQWLAGHDDSWSGRHLWLPTVFLFSDLITLKLAFSLDSPAVNNVWI